MEQWKEQTQPVDSRALLEMMMHAAAAAENFGRLARCFQGCQGDALSRMARESRAMVACLGGIFALVTGEPPRRQVPIPDGGTVQARLKKAYARALQLLSACTRRTGDGEYGPVFQRLALRQQEHCRGILEIIGSLSAN